MKSIKLYGEYLDYINEQQNQESDLTIDLQQSNKQLVKNALTRNRYDVISPEEIDQKIKDSLEGMKRDLINKDLYIEAVMLPNYLKDNEQVRFYVKEIGFSKDENNNLLPGLVFKLVKAQYDSNTGYFKQKPDEKLLVSMDLNGQTAFFNDKKNVLEPIGKIVDATSAKGGLKTIFNTYVKSLGSKVKMKPVVKAEQPVEKPRVAPPGIR
jgi:hypothetical protein